MIAKMTVCEEKDVEIPDIPSEVMTLITRYEGTVTLRTSLEDYGEGWHAKLWFGIEPHKKDVVKHDALLEALDACKQYDIESMSPFSSQPWFESEAEDGLVPCQEFIQYTKKLYPDVKFT